MTAQYLHLRDDGIVDDVAIERRVAGEPVPLTTRELAVAIRRMAELGHTRTVISRQLRVNGARVARILTEQQIDVIAAGSTRSEDVALAPSRRPPAA